MKHLLIIILTFVFSTSCSAKQVVMQQENKIKIETKAKVEAQKKPVLVEEKTKATTNKTQKIPLPPKPPKQLKTETFNHNRWTKLLQQFVSKQGNVNYKKIRDNRFQLDIYIDILSHNLPTKNWTKNEKLAYWINAYNAFTVDLIIRNYPVKSIKDIKNPWKQRLWQLGEKWYNLDEIEHKILRKMNEPRIHFAIVCASFSCPKLQNEAFTASNLETQLTHATKEFLSDTKRNKISENNIKISNIFKWFKKDFETNGTLIDFLNTYSEVRISEKAKKTYLDYNWNLNE